MANDGPVYMGEYRNALRNQLGAAQVKCCEAGQVAYPDPCPWHGDKVTPAELRDAEVMDGHVDVYARQVIVSTMEEFLQHQYKSATMMGQTDWNRIRDRMHYILGEMGPEEAEFREAERYLHGNES